MDGSNLHTAVYWNWDSIIFTTYTTQSDIYVVKNHVATAAATTCAVGGESGVGGSGSGGGSRMTEWAAAAVGSSCQKPIAYHAEAQLWARFVR